MARVIACIHGFKTGEYHDFDLFARYCQEHPELYDGEVLKINLYDINDRKSFAPRKWLKVALAQLQPYLDGKHEIYLIGYSMSAGVAAAIASKVPIAKVILIAPFFHILGSKMLTHNTRLMVKNIKMRLFHPKKAKRLKRFQKLRKKIVPFRLIIAIAWATKKFKRYVRRINCETLVVMGLADDYAPLRSASFVFKKVRTKRKELWFIDHVNHLFIFSKDIAPEIFVKIISFINGSQITANY